MAIKSIRMGYTSQQGAILLVAAALLLLLQVGNCHDDDCHVCYLEHRQCQSACDVYHLLESREGVDCQWDCARHFEHCCPQASTRILDENATTTSSTYTATVITNTNNQPQQQQQVDPVVQICLDTVSVANANQDDILTYQEYQQHLNLFKIAICPPIEEEETEQEEEEDDDDEKGEETDSQPDNKDTVKSYVKPYATEQDLQFMFADVSCLLCLGLFDPYNYDKAAEGFFDDCPGCDNNNDNSGDREAISSSLISDKGGGNITLSNQTPQETKVFCHWAYDWVLPQCHRQQRRHHHDGQQQSTTNTALWGNSIIL